LKKEYPGDLEIELNYAEALLWNKKFDEIFYTTLVKKTQLALWHILGSQIPYLILKNLRAL
jgi:hypothetical protein